MARQKGQFKRKPLVDLHAHIAPSIHPAVLWSIAHVQGVKLSTKDYWEFVDKIVLSQRKKTTLKKYLDTVYHPILDKLSTGTIALEKAVHETFGGAYRSNHITVMELRGNPMKHNAAGAQDLDHIIMAMLRGMEWALLEYPQIQAGIIFCLDRQFPFAQNAIIVEKAIKYRNRGVVGIDFANYRKGAFHFKDYVELIAKARKAGLGITAHSGETDDTNDMWEALEFVKPHRIGHGIRAAYDKKLMRELVKRKIVLEVCPMSNLATQAVENVEELKFILRTFIENNVLFTINTDWPEVIEHAHLSEQLAFLEKEKLMTTEEINRCVAIGRAATFTKKGGIEAYL